MHTFLSCYYFYLEDGWLLHLFDCSVSAKEAFGQSTHGHPLGLSKQGKRICSSAPRAIEYEEEA